MSERASIIVNFKNDLDVISLFESFKRNNLFLLDKEGYAFFRPLGDVDDYDYVSEVFDNQTQLYKILKKKWKRKEDIGINLYDEENNQIDLLILPNSLIFSFVSPKKIESTNFIDFSYYLKRMNNAFIDSKLIFITIELLIDYQ